MYLSTSTLLIFKYKYKSFFHQSTYVQVQILFKVPKYKYFSSVNDKVNLKKIHHQVYSKKIYNYTLIGCDLLITIFITYKAHYYYCLFYFSDYRYFTKQQIQHIKNPQPAIGLISHFKLEIN